ncbi:transcriptional regulator GcvA [Burkholderia plantarii]|uniref:transcriptional regulator GcvA n=1 Tax=Burkholderia plantarii TaxID=41899 RepID=UPI0009F4507F|nr:transcriptional regulator GcvA [Burkholderia plantarii]WLE59678.1 transcriptional regulator GcvA [Burkholderia plantarii]
MPRPLPPLLSLRAFEAAARRLSFSLAAQELFVTQGAVSHQIHKLETDLGVVLFDRRARGVELTSEGHAYYARVHQAFALLRLGTEELRGRAPGRTTLSVGVLASFATHWLAPRLATFSAAHPQIDLQLHSSIALADLGAGEVDLAIRYGRGGWPDVEARKLMPERLAPVCAPSLLASGPPPRMPPRTPRELLRFPLLSSYSQYTFEWDAWAAHVGLDLGNTKRVQLHDYNIVVEAAIAGQGIAIGRHRLIARQLATGALVRPLPGLVLDHAEIGWWLVMPRRRPGEAAAAFIDWLVAAAARDSFDALDAPDSLAGTTRQDVVATAGATHESGSCVAGKD